MDERRSGTRRAGDLRDRRGRGVRGPLALSGPHAPAGVPVGWKPSDAFDDAVMASVERLQTRHVEPMRQIDIGVEHYPVVPDDWERRVPFATCSAATADERARIVLFRRPLVTHATTTTELVLLVHEALVDQLALLWSCDPDDVDPPEG